MAKMYYEQDCDLQVLNGTGPRAMLMHKISGIPDAM